MKSTDNIFSICACSNLRKASRTITQLYDTAFQSAGIKVTQYSMLVNIKRNPNISISELGEVMLLDQTTVTRNINILKKMDYVFLTKDKEDSRIKQVNLTEKGEEKIKETEPVWLKIQQKIIGEIGEDAYQTFFKTLLVIQQFAHKEK